MTKQMDMFRKCLCFLSCSTLREDIFNVLDGLVAELSSLEQLPLISENNPWADHMVEKIYSCKSGLRFLRLFFWSTSTLDDTDADIRDMLMISVYRCRYQRFFFWSTSKSWILDLQGRIQNCKQKFQQSKVDLLLGYSLRCNNPLNNNSDEIVEFLADILQNLKDLSKFKTGDEIVLLNNQIETLERKVTLLHNLFKLTPVEWRDFEEMRAFNVVVYAFAQYSASLVFLYWVKAVDEDMATQLNVLLFNVLQKYKPCVPAFKSVYIIFLDEMKSRRLEHSLLSGQIVQSFLDLLLENLSVHISKEDFQIIQESLFFVISFLVNPLDQHEKLMMLEMDLLLREDLYRVLTVDVDGMHGNFSKATACLGDFTRKAELVMSKIQQVYTRTSDSFSYDFPKINGLGFFDFLLQDLSFLKDKLKRDTNFIPFAKRLIIQIEEELMSLRHYLDDLFERQKEDKELKDAWLNVIDLAYKTEYAINSCSAATNPLWYNMARLMEVLDKLKDVNRNLNTIEGIKPHDGAVLHCSTFALNKVSKHPWTPSFNEVMVGLEEKADIIFENLIYGSKTLDIVAIVGMPGLGKTTMANKVYNAPAVRNHFHVFAYCIVSQAYSRRRILLDILGDIRGEDDEMYEMTVEDLADKLRKCLLGKRYLIIMDDIWDVKPWDDIKSSFPNNQNGSRVIFTSRNRNVALLAKKNCIIHEIRFLSDEESWQLLQKKAFQSEGCPPDLLEIGKMIANNCKGLPLTVVLIGGLLRTERSLRWWSKISEAVSTYVLTEDVMSVLEFSYQHLPEHLKPCFLYFGAFVEDELIRVNKLALLWIAEGFVPTSKLENLENVAREYLNDLVDRSLVIVDKRSSYGGIKSCRTHDLVHEFCQRKAQEENLFKLKVNHEASGSSSSLLSNPYRLSIHAKGAEFDARNICPSIRSLLLSCKVQIHGHGPYDLSNLKLVQVVDLEELNDCAYFMRKMQSGVHLRFMSSSARFRILPNDFLSNHWNLEILILSEATFGILPEAFWNLTRLRHVKVSQWSVSNSCVQKREACPRSHPQLANLESFSMLCVDSTEELEVFLQRSPSLRKLGLVFPDHYMQFPKVDSLSRLESLKVLLAGEACLRSFNLVSSLKKLSLMFCFLDWRYLSVISKMPCLEVLKLLRNAVVGPKWDMEDTQFPKLRFLKLHDLKLVEWIAYQESFPSLEVLIVKWCSRLETIPPCFGEILTLKRIEVDGSLKSVGASVVEIQEAQKDSGNEELRVILTGLDD